jgi:hypothetical protein
MLQRVPYQPLIPSLCGVGAGKDEALLSDNRLTATLDRASSIRAKSERPDTRSRTRDRSASSCIDSSNLGRPTSGLRPQGGFIYVSIVLEKSIFTFLLCHLCFYWDKTAHALPARLAFGSGSDFMNRQICAVKFLLRVETNANGLLEQSVNDCTACQSNGYA